MEEPIREFHGALEQFLAEVDDGDIPAGHDEHDAQHREIDEVDDHHRKEGAMFNEIGLSLPEHPDGEGDMKTPGESDDTKQPSSVRFHIDEQADRAVKQEGQNAVDREKIRCQ